MQNLRNFSLNLLLITFAMWSACSEAYLRRQFPRTNRADVIYLEGNEIVWESCPENTVAEPGCSVGGGREPREWVSRTPQDAYVLRGQNLFGVLDRAYRGNNAVRTVTQELEFTVRDLDRALTEPERQRATVLRDELTDVQRRLGLAETELFRHVNSLTPDRLNCDIERRRCQIASLAMQRTFYVPSNRLVYFFSTRTGRWNDLTGTTCAAPWRPVASTDFSDPVKFAFEHADWVREHGPLWAWTTNSSPPDERARYRSRETGVVQQDTSTRGMPNWSPPALARGGWELYHRPRHVTAVRLGRAERDQQYVQDIPVQEDGGGPRHAVLCAQTLEE